MRWLGRALVALVLVHRAVGCTPADGSEGGKCEQGCNRDYCENGLECDPLTDKCVQAQSQWPPPSGCNFDQTDPKCAPGQIAYTCAGGSSPASENNVPGCTDTASDKAGNELYCCTPTCTERSTPRCGAPSTTYICSGDATPEDSDSTSTCYSLFGYWGFTEYCCASANTCFGGPPDVFLSPDCSGDALELCTGSSTPLLAGKTCSAVAITDGGPGVVGYCCTPSTGDADAGDGG